MSVYFRCEKCGKRIREYDGENYQFPERELPPLRNILTERKKTASRQLCDACWIEWKEGRYEIRKELVV